MAFIANCKAWWRNWGSDCKALSRSHSLLVINDPGGSVRRLLDLILLFEVKDFESEIYKVEPECKHFQLNLTDFFFLLEEIEFKVKKLKSQSCDNAYLTQLKFLELLIWEIVDDIFRHILIQSKNDHIGVLLLLSQSSDNGMSGNRGEPQLRRGQFWTR